MLKLDALDQLKQLKSDIKASRNLQLGRVKGTGQKFGFVTLDSGRDVFLPPAEMLRVLPGDRVEVEIKKDDRNKTFAHVERLVESTNKEFFGKYVAKGTAHFAEADFDGSTRWIFIPPNKRGKTKVGDLLKCKLVQHPIKNGKPQAHIVEVLGSESSKGIEWVYSLAKHHIAEAWSKPAETELANLNEDRIEALCSERDDLSELPFFTIDGERTRDMDDALYIESDGKGWLLSVAIADPEALISAVPELENAVLERSASLYAPGKIVPMLPEKLSSDLCSLVEGKKRLAKVFKIQVNEHGELTDFTISQAAITSAQKVSYKQASDTACSELKSEVAEQLPPLKCLAETMLAWRKNNACVQQGRAEFYLELNENQKIDTIKPRETHVAHTWVEECMLLVNRCAARYLADNSKSSIYISHSGARADRVESLQQVLSESVDELKELNLAELSSFRQVMQTLNGNDDLAELRQLLLRQLERTAFTSSPEPHFGLGFDMYTTVTSPLRKANDYLLHKQLRQIITEQGTAAMDKKVVNAIDTKQDDIRKAVFDIEQWLKCEYMMRQQDVFDAEVVRVFTTGVQLRLKANGIEGVISTRDIEGKCSFNQDRMHLKTSVGDFQLLQEVKVKPKRVDWSKKQIQFELA